MSECWEYESLVSLIILANFSDYGENSLSPLRTSVMGSRWIIAEDEEESNLHLFQPHLADARRIASRNLFVQLANNQNVELKWTTKPIIHAIVYVHRGWSMLTYTLRYTQIHLIQYSLQASCQLDISLKG